MTESGAIVIALADAFPDRGLAPPGLPLSPARADYLQVIHTCGAALDMMLWQIRVHRHILLEDQKDQRTIDRYERKFVGEAMPAFLDRLERQSYVCGDEFTAADCMFGHVVLWAQTYGLCREPAFIAYLERLRERSAFQAAFADADEFDPVPPRGIMESGVFLG